jgi:hypothetical protein
MINLIKVNRSQTKLRAKVRKKRGKKESEIIYNSYVINIMLKKSFIYIINKFNVFFISFSN